jgi:hypothetical protein
MCAIFAPCAALSLPRSVRSNPSGAWLGKGLANEVQRVAAGGESERCRRGELVVWYGEALLSGRRFVNLRHEAEMIQADSGQRDAMPRESCSQGSCS